MSKSELLPKRTFALIEAPYRGGDQDKKFMLVQSTLHVSGNWGTVRANEPVLVHPSDATHDSIEAILRGLLLKFEWEATGLCEVTYPEEMRFYAAQEWRKRFRNRNGMCPKLEQAIDADPKLQEFVGIKAGGAH